MSTSGVVRPERQSRGRRALWLSAAAGLVLAGCTADQFGMQETGSLYAFRHTDRHPIIVEPGAVQLEIETPGFTRGLSPRQAGQVRAFLADYKKLGEGELAVTVPSGTANEAAVMAAVTEFRNMTVAAGIPRTAIRYIPYGGSGPGSEPPIVVSYERFFATPSECGNWPHNIADLPYDQNQPYPEFGCATQNNLAAMVADPRDLIGHRPMGPGDAARRRVVLDAWRQGDVTAAERSEEESASVSEIE